MDNSINVSNPQILNHKIYLLHYLIGVDDVRFSQGKILNINSSNIMCLTDYWPEPGSPIIDYENDLMVGIHKGGKKEDNNKSSNGLGIMLKYAVEEFIKKKREEINCFYKNLYPQSETMDMIYIIPNNKPIHIFCGKFVERYKEKCEIIYNETIFPLTEYFPLSYIIKEDKDKGEIKITLKGINYITNMNYMFIDMSKVKYMEATFEWCKNLEELSNTSK